MRSLTSPIKNILARAMLALVFLCAQQTASLHWLSHAIDATQGKAKASHGTGPSHHCDECLTVNALGAGMAGSGPALPADAAQHALLATQMPASSPATLRLAFRSRAPPTLS